VLLGWLLLSEPLGWRVAVGAGVILCGVAVVKAAPRQRTEDEGRGTVESEKADDVRVATQKVCSAVGD
jgi:hypothetical protein